LGKLDRKAQPPGLTKGWGHPIGIRIDMLAGGIGPPPACTLCGPDQESVAAAAQQA
jgi:Cu/Ag efflux pump CusA